VSKRVVTSKFTTHGNTYRSSVKDCIHYRVVTSKFEPRIACLKKRYMEHTRMGKWQNYMPLVVHGSQGIQKWKTDRNITDLSLLFFFFPKAASPSRSRRLDVNERFTHNLHAKLDR
jgi:hypothetical protein